MLEQSSVMLAPYQFSLLQFSFVPGIFTVVWPLQVAGLSSGAGSRLTSDRQNESGELTKGAGFFEVFSFVMKDTVSKMYW